MLQRSAGNAAVGALLRAGVARAKLRVAPADDPLEDEADRAADALTSEAPCACDGGSCDECQTKRADVMRSASDSAGAGAELSEASESVLRDIGPGRPLDPSTREPFESHFGRDFSAVRIHDNPTASSAAESVQARAFTLGGSIAFRTGEFCPQTARGQHLLAHELAHTVQQGVARENIQRDDGDGDGGSGAPPAPSPPQTTSDPSTQPTSTPGPIAPNLDDEYNTAVNIGDWQAAAEWLNAFNYADIMSRLALLTPTQIANIHQGALDNSKVGPDSQVAQLTAPNMSQTPPQSSPDQPAPTPDTPPPDLTAQMGVFDKLEEATRRGVSKLIPTLGQQVVGLLDPKSIAIGVGLWAASHAEGLGELVDLAALILEGLQFKQILEDLWDYAQLATDATKDADLDAAGQKFADAVIAAGLAKLIEVLAKFAKEGQAAEGKGASEETPPEKPPAQEENPQQSGTNDEPKQEQEPAEEKTEEGLRIVDQFASADGARSIEIVENGEARVCFRCPTVEDNYKNELPKQPDAAAELKDGEQQTDPATKRAEITEAEQKLADEKANPKGSPTEINPKDAPENIRALTRENESAQILAREGHDVTQNPSVPGPKNPDFLVDGQIYDNYAPTTSTSRSIWSVVKGKVESGQASRIVLNLDDSAVSLEALAKQFSTWPIEGLVDVIVIKGGKSSSL
jgi:Domain of unknown function (DUF4157)/Contact-dependent growth inhibition CdiA C-terminal domain